MSSSTVKKSEPKICITRNGWLALLYRQVWLKFKSRTGTAKYDCHIVIRRQWIINMHAISGLAIWAANWLCGVVLPFSRPVKPQPQHPPFILSFSLLSTTSMCSIFSGFYIFSILLFPVFYCTAANLAHHEKINCIDVEDIGHLKHQFIPMEMLEDVQSSLSCNFNEIHKTCA